MSVDIRTIENDSKLNEILNRDFLHERSHYVEVGPEKIIVPGKFQKFHERIQRFKVRDDDVFVLAFPKSGSRWTQEMVWLILNNLDYNQARNVFLDHRSPLLEIEILFDNFSTEELNRIGELESPRCIRSHLQWTLLPKAITNGTKQPKMIVVLRGPEDTCISYYHQAKVIEGYRGNWDDFCALFLGGKVPLGPYWKHVLGVWDQRHMPNIMFIKYNKMKADLAETIQNVATFLGKELSDDDVKNLCEHLSFDNLKKSPGFNMESIITMGKGDVNPFLRQGKIGDHKNVMSPEVIEAFKKQREECLAGTGLTFD